VVRQSKEGPGRGKAIAGLMTTPSNPSLYWTEYGIPIHNLWHMLLYAWDEVPLSHTGLMTDVEHAPTLDALFASILVKLAQQRMRIGLGRDYQDTSYLLRGIRGPKPPPMTCVTIYAVPSDCSMKWIGSSWTWI
jgi:hypothetical protein